MAIFKRFDFFVSLALQLIPHSVKASSNINESVNFNQTSLFPALPNATSVLHGIYPDIFRQGRPQIQRPEGPPQKKPLDLDEFLSSQRGHLETFYEPYWFNGHWVFDRQFTQKPYIKTTKSVVTEKLSQDCNQFCPRIFKLHGMVCGIRLGQKKWQYEYKEFDDICQLEIENCKMPSKLWNILHRGICAEVKGYHAIGQDVDIVNRKKKILEDLQKPRFPII